MKLYLAPLNVLSNNAFRKLCLFYGANYVFTEMVWAERILNKNEFEEIKLQIDDEKHTIIQVIAENSKSILSFVKLLKKRYSCVPELNFNMGCPQSTMSKRMLGGGILKDKEKMKEYAIKFSKACKKYDFTPSVKIRVGVDKPDLESYLKIIKLSGINKVYIHARTLTQGYAKPADYLSLKKTKLNGFDIIVNGDIKCKGSLLKAMNSVKCSGAMIGRAALNDPTIFYRLKGGKTQPSKKEVLLKFLEYAKDLPKATLKRNISWLTQNMVHGAIIRHKINSAKTIDEIKKVIISI
jgi:tRNA-dihydrouridine synthase B